MRLLNVKVLLDHSTLFGPFQNIFTFRDSVHPENHKLRTIYYKLSITDKEQTDL